MAYLNLYREKLRKNHAFLDDMFKRNGIEWAIVTKILCGTKNFIEETISLGTEEVCDSRISNLRIVKEMRPDIQTVYIKPPALEIIEDLVKYADASFNTEFRTIKWISDEAVKQKKTHKIIIMIELGDLREGIMGDHLMDFYASVFQLPNITVTGIGANLNCLHGVMPSADKLIQLSLYKQLIEAKFERKIPWVTGGTSVVIPLIMKKQIPKGINHFRIGESLFFGLDLFTGEVIPGMEADVFKLYAQIIEITKKPMVPTGDLEKNPSGEMYVVDEKDYGRTTFRAILDIGRLDVAEEYLMPEDEEITMTGASSDMLVIDLGDNENNYTVGDLVPFRLKYMGALGLLNSYYVTKNIIDKNGEIVPHEHGK